MSVTSVAAPRVPPGATRLARNGGRWRLDGRLGSAVVPPSRSPTLSVACSCSSVHTRIDHSSIGLRPAGLNHSSTLPLGSTRQPTLPGRRSKLPSSIVCHAKAAAAAAPVAAAVAESWIKATGVPLLEVLRQMTLRQAALHSAGLMLATVVGVLIGNKLLALVGARLEAVNERMRRSSGLDLLLGTALASMHRPALVLLPWYGLFYILLVASAFADVAVSRLDAQIHAVSHLCAAQLLDGLNHISQLMQDTSELVLIIFGAWFLISWKDHLIRNVLSQCAADENEEPNLARVLVPFSNLLSWAIVVGASMITLTAFGVNVQPLLAIGSVGTVAVGFAAQSTMQNVVSALQIYSSRPFIVGDRIQLKSLSGTVIVTGMVEHIAPMRTVVRGDNKLPVFINNKDVMNLIVVNESKLRRDSVMPKLPLVTANLTMRYKDVDLVGPVEKAVTEYLTSHPDVDQAISARCVLTEFTPQGPLLSMRALLHRRAASRQAFVLSELLRGAEQIIRAHGGYLASQESVAAHADLPPCPPPAVPSFAARAASGNGGGSAVAGGGNGSKTGTGGSAGSGSWPGGQSGSGLSYD